ncbi:hypothetical protein UFOVP315_44 [uncultured Caudovirales phage]|uniref:Terminase n=1 Tax=uncultured Caudovirales phage TaxID=2100421 RepID=A0A6J5LSA5_9CAUD|nr:hypothetical protein UFOVP315_44 [uncultured Caudovirales phage]
MTSLPPEQARKIEALQTSLPYLAGSCLRIMSKAGGLIPFNFNQAQAHLHEQIEKLRAETGMVRVLLLKARQTTGSTYVAGRYFQKTMYQKGKRSFIMAHDAETTNKLFGMVKLFYDSMPEQLRMPIKASNARELIFGTQFSQYYVGTAGNASVGRGGTIQYFHGSEVAFWPTGDEILTGVLQSVADVPGTEVILESTANGMNGLFYTMCMDALAGRGRFKLIFIPWFFMKEYRATVPPGFTRRVDKDDNEVELAELYGLDDGQLQWRRNKIADFGGRLWMFKQEYPSNPVEAFQTSGDSLIPVEAVMAARKRQVLPNKNAPVIYGVDPGRTRDRAVVARRNNRKLSYKVIPKPADGTLTEMQLAGILITLIKQTLEDGHRTVRMFIDVGYGWGAYDRMVELGWGDYVTAVDFGDQKTLDPAYLNKRAEMHCNLRDAITKEGYAIPDNDEVHADLTATPDYKQTSSGQIQLEPKEMIRKRLKRSPDIADAMALTFAYPVQLTEASEPDNIETQVRKMAGRKSPLASRRK